MKPSDLGTSGLATSASISSTVKSRSDAMLIARLMAQNVLPSPGRELATMISLADFPVVASVSKALSSNGRLTNRNSSAISDLSANGVTMPWSCSRSRSILTCLLVRPDESEPAPFLAGGSDLDSMASRTTVASADGSSVRVDAGAKETSSTGGLKAKVAPSPSFAAAFSTDDRPLASDVVLSRSF